VVSQGLGHPLKLIKIHKLFGVKNNLANPVSKKKLWKIFQSRKSKIKQKEQKIHRDSPFTLPKVKVVKEELIQHKTTLDKVKISAFWPQTPILKKNDIKRNKSMPLPKPTYYPESYAKPKLTKSVATQTDHSGFGHKKLSRMKTPQITGHEKRRLSREISVGLANRKDYSVDMSDTSSDSSANVFEKTCNMEVLQSLTIGESNFIDSIFNKSDITSPTFIMETEEDTDSDVDSDGDDNYDDDASLNIYEEVLNHDGYRHRHQNERYSRSELMGHPTTFHQNSCYLLTNNKIVEKKKLSRMAKSNPPHPCNLGLFQKHEGLKSQEDKECKTKVKGLKKTLSEKMSRFRTNQLYTL